MRETSDVYDTRNAVHTCIIDMRLAQRGYFRHENARCFTFSIGLPLERGSVAPRGWIGRAVRAFVS